MSERELLPCPFCGRPVELRYERRSFRPDTYSISCGFVSCGINPSTGEHLDEPQAIAAWNRRSPSRSAILDEALRRCVKEMRGSIAFTHEYDDALAAADAALKEPK
jgi:hypothetical protein